MLDKNLKTNLIKGMDFECDFCHNDKTPASKACHNLKNYSVFNLYLYADSASMVATYGHIGTYIKEDEDVFVEDHMVLFMNITYKKGLHILKCFGFEKDSARFLPFDVDIGDNIDYSNAIYYEENWKKIQ